MRSKAVIPGDRRPTLNKTIGYHRAEKGVHVPFRRVLILSISGPHFRREVRDILVAIAFGRRCLTNQSSAGGVRHNNRFDIVQSLDISLVLQQTLRTQPTSNVKCIQVGGGGGGGHPSVWQDFDTKSSCRTFLLQLSICSLFLTLFPSLSCSPSSTSHGAALDLCRCLSVIRSRTK